MYKKSAEIETIAYPTRTFKLELSFKAIFHYFFQ